jgi:hypothetical protein
MAYAAEPADMAIDREVVWWIGENEVGTAVSHQQVEDGAVTRIAADQPVAPKEPHVALPGDGGRIWEGGNLIVRLRGSAR